MKNILVINYSQTGQLDQIIDNFLLPFENQNIERVKIFPKKAFPFPWTNKEFFDAMPETVLEENTELEPYNLKSDDYDLILLGYQPWFLSPSIPTTALLLDDKFKSIIKDKDVITIIGARNMWLNSQESVKDHIKNAGGNLVANIPLIDRNNNHISAITILYWMLTGKKDRFLNVFPYPGISTEDIKGSSRFGEIVHNAIHQDSLSQLQSKILDLNLITIKTNILFIELRAKKLFMIWAKLIKNSGSNKKSRAIRVRFFKYYLLVALFFAAPIVYLFYYFLIMPFSKASINRKKAYFYGK